jgi:hypothetical protein
VCKKREKNRKKWDPQKSVKTLKYDRLKIDKFEICKKPPKSELIAPEALLKSLFFKDTSKSPPKSAKISKSRGVYPAHPAQT